MLRYD